MKRIWAPLDLHGLRLYSVLQAFPNHSNWDKTYIVPAKSPTHAAKIIEDAYSTADFLETPYYKGMALRIFQPESWVNGSAPDPALDQCQHTNQGLIQSGRYAGDSGTGSDNVSICLNCGIVQVFGDRNGQHFEISIHIYNHEYLDAIKRWVDYVNGETKEENKPWIGVDIANGNDESVTP